MAAAVDRIVEVHHQSDDPQIHLLSERQGQSYAASQRGTLRYPSSRMGRTSHANLCAVQSPSSCQYSSDDHGSRLLAEIECVVHPPIHAHSTVTCTNAILQRQSGIDLLYATNLFGPLKNSDSLVPCSFKCLTGKL